MPAGSVPGSPDPWAAPGMPRKVVRWLFAQHAPLMLGHASTFGNGSGWPPSLPIAPANVSPQQSKDAAHRALQQGLPGALREETGIAYDHGSGGVLQVFQTEDELAALNAPPRYCSPSMSRIALSMPQMPSRSNLPLAKTSWPCAGGLHLPDDETGDCHLFTTRLAELLREKASFFVLMPRSRN